MFVKSDDSIFSSFDTFHFEFEQFAGTKLFVLKFYV